MSGKYHLTKKEVALAKKRGKVYNTPLFVLRVAKRDDKKGGLAVIISKKMEKLAVKRNRVRRRIRNVIFKRKDFISGHNILVFVKKRAFSAEYGDFESCFGRIFDNINR